MDEADEGSQQAMAACKLPILIVVVAGAERGLDC